LITRRESVEKRGLAMRAQRCASTLKALPIAMSDEDQNKPAPALGPEVMAAIGRELRRMYAEIIAEGVRGQRVHTFEQPADLLPSPLLAAGRRNVPCVALPGYGFVRLVAG